MGLAEDIQATAAGINSAVNQVREAVDAMAQRKLEKEKYEWEKQQAALKMEREDNAYTRAVSDMMKAGLNPAGLQTQTQGGQAEGHTPFDAPKWLQRMHMTEQMAQMLYGMNDMRAGVSLKNAQAEQANAQTAKARADEQKAQLEIDYLNTIAEDRIKKYQAEIEKIQESASGQRIVNNIQRQLAQGYVTAQELQNKGQETYNRMLENEEKMTAQDWKFLETFGISREMTLDERKANWKTAVLTLEAEGEIQKLKTQTWNNDAITAMNMHDNIKFRQASETAQGWINNISGAFGNTVGAIGSAMTGTGAIMRGLSFLRGNVFNKTFNNTSYNNANSIEFQNPNM